MARLTQEELNKELTNAVIAGDRAKIERIQQAKAMLKKSQDEEKTKEYLEKYKKSGRWARIKKRLKKEKK